MIIMLIFLSRREICFSAMKTKKGKRNRQFMFSNHTLEALDRLVPAGARSAYVDGVLARHLGVERSIVDIIDEQINDEKNIQKND